MLNIIEKRHKFEKLLLNKEIYPLTVIYHGSCFRKPKVSSDIDVVLVLEKIDGKLIRKIHNIKMDVGGKLGITLITTREAGTIFGGAKYIDAVFRVVGGSKNIPLAYMEISSLTQLFRKQAIDFNAKKCINISKIIVKVINNHLRSKYRLDIRSFDKNINSLEKNLNNFYVKIGIKPQYYEDIFLITK